MLHQESGSASPGGRNKVTDCVFGVAVFCSACGVMQMISGWRAASDAAHLRYPLCEGDPLWPMGPYGHVPCGRASSEIIQQQSIGTPYDRFYQLVVTS
jgi:hypothetical protein